MMISRRISGLSARPGAALVSGLAMGFAQPDWGLWPLAFIALAPLLWAIHGVGLRGRLALGWWFGTAATLTTPWLPGAIGFSNYFGLSPILGSLAALAVAQLFGAGSMMLFAGLSGDGAGACVRRALQMAAAWIAAEWLRGLLFTGLPWMLLAHSLQPVPALAQLASVAGVYSVSGALVLCNAAAAEFWIGSSRRDALTIAAIGFALLVVPIGRVLVPLQEGKVSVDPNHRTSEPGPGLRVSLIQGASRPERRYRPGSTALTIEQLVGQTRALGASDLVVWPETALRVLWPENKQLIADVMPSLGAPWLLLGVPRAEAGRFYNAAVLVGAETISSGAHDKVRLLPFAEKTPWPFTAKPGDLTAGASPRTLELETPSSGATRIGPLICYEILFGDLTRSQVSQGAGILVNLSNEAWFGSTRAMRQNLAAAVFRSIEVGRPVLRATNSGLTAAIDARGRIAAQIPPEQPGGLAVRVRPGTESTIYTRWGYMFPAVVSIGVMLLPVARRRRPRCDQGRSAAR